MGHVVAAIHHNAHRVTKVAARLDDGATEDIAGDHFISSMALRDLLERWDPPPPATVLQAARELKYRDFLVVALIVRRADLFPDNWIYVHDPSVKVGRIQNFRAWSPDMVPTPDRACLGLEYFCLENDSLWTMPDGDLIAFATREIERIGLVRPAEVEDGCVLRVTKAYPVYDAHYERHVRVVREYLEQFPNFQVVGRNGMHKYNNQDHSMMTALLAARNIMGHRFDVWKVNTDAEYLEEDRSDEPAARAVPQPRTTPLRDSSANGAG